MKRAWFLGVGPGDVAERALLVGDPARVDLFAAELDEAALVGESRGLRVLTGSSGGVPVTVSSFGMGAPIAAVVVDELAQVGVRTVLRVGTVMALAPDLLGELVVAAAALRGEGTSATYVPASFPAVADLDLLAGTVLALEHLGERYRVGLVASLDGFYSEMLAVRPEREEQVAERLGELARLGALAVDMETSAVLAVGRALGLRAGSLCLASVDGATQATLSPAERRAAETRLVRAALDAIVAAEDAFRAAVAAAVSHPAS